MPHWPRFLSRPRKDNVVGVLVDVTINTDSRHLTALTTTLLTHHEARHPSVEYQIVEYGWDATSIDGLNRALDAADRERDEDQYVLYTPPVQPPGTGTFAQAVDLITHTHTHPDGTPLPWIIRDLATYRQLQAGFHRYAPGWATTHPTTVIILPGEYRVRKHAAGSLLAPEYDDPFPTMVCRYMASPVAYSTKTAPTVTRLNTCPLARTVHPPWATIDQIPPGSTVTLHGWVPAITPDGFDFFTWAHEHHIRFTRDDPAGRLPAVYGRLPDPTGQPDAPKLRAQLPIDPAPPAVSLTELPDYTQPPVSSLSSPLPESQPVPGLTVADYLAASSFTGGLSATNQPPPYPNHGSPPPPPWVPRRQVIAALIGRLALAIATGSARTS